MASGPMSTLIAAGVMRGDIAGDDGSATSSGGGSRPGDGNRALDGGKLRSSIEKFADRLWSHSNTSIFQSS